MGEEVRIAGYDVGGGDEDGRVLEWEAGLPELDDLTPLSQSLISAELLSAFSITPEPYRTMMDVNRASRNTFSDLRGQSEQQSLAKLNSLKSFRDDKVDDTVVDGEETADLTRDGLDLQKLRRIDSGGDGGGTGAGEEADDSSARASKRPRLVWTPQLHKRFIEVVAHLGVKIAVPKTIMQLMNVEGLTRENVASHLQKYRQYLKRIQGLPNQDPSSSDNLFASPPVPQNLHEAAGGNGHRHAPGMIPMPYPSLHMAPNSARGAYHHGFDSHSYPSNITMQQRDWSGIKFGSVSAYQHHLTPNNK